MKFVDKNMIRFHLDVVHGITVKCVEKKRDKIFVGGSKIFGVPLENLQRCYIPEFGLVPCFMVDACSVLLERAGTVGLFRTPGSLLRIRTIRAKLNCGEACLHTAPPYDVATLVKQFCRELPEPLFPPELHAALLEAQALPALQDGRSALQLLSCLLPARHASCLHYLFNFLHRVSQRCSENLMTSSNLATVFAPCLLPPPNKAEMSEGRLTLRVLVLQTFIENPDLFGVIPKAVLDSIDFLKLYLKDSHPKIATRKRRSLKVMRSFKMAPWIHGRTKVKSPVPEQEQESPPDRQKLRRSLGLDTFPNVQLFRTCVPSADQESRPATSSLHSSSPVGKETAKVLQDRLKRDLHVHFQGSSEDAMQTVTQCLTNWRRRSSL